MPVHSSPWSKACWQNPLLVNLASIHTWPLYCHWSTSHIWTFTLWSDDLYIYIYIPNSRALLPTFCTNCPDGSHFAQIGSHFAQNTTSNPLFFTQPSPTPFWDMYVHKTPPNPPQNTPFSGLILKLGILNYCLGKMDPIWAKCLKSWQNFSRSWQKKIFIKEGTAILHLQYSMSRTAHPQGLKAPLQWLE